MVFPLFEGAGQGCLRGIQGLLSNGGQVVSGFLGIDCLGVDLRLARFYHFIQIAFGFEIHELWMNDLIVLHFSLQVFLRSLFIDRTISRCLRSISIPFLVLNIQLLSLVVIQRVTV